MKLGFRCPFCEKMMITDLPEMTEENYTKEAASEAVMPLYDKHVLDHTNELELEVYRAQYRGYRSEGS